MKFLITGGAGFIGSNYLHYVVEKYPEDEFVCLDALTYAGNFNNIKSLCAKENFRFIKGDIRNKDFIEGLFDTERFDYVVNFAAESHVDNSIKNPNIFAETNILGTINLLNAAKKYGIRRYHQVSTDEVYGDLPLDEPEKLFTENSPIKASSPYAASKASADLEVLAFARTFGLPVTISRCSNNYGPYQFPEKLIPVTISKALKNEPIPVYGEGKNVRDWIHVHDHNIGVDMIVRNGKDGRVYNLGGNSERTNLELVKTILKILGKPESLIEFVKDRPGHDLRYATDYTYATEELGWKPEHTFEEGIKATVKWYQENQSWLDEILTGAYLESYEAKKLAIIGANEFQNKLILKARSMGYETHVFAWQDGSVGERTANFFYPISIVEKDKILEKCQTIKPEGICSIASDLAAITVNYVADKLKLAGNPVEQTLCCTNKYEMRKELQEKNLKTPHFVKVTKDEKIEELDLDAFEFPLIVKPTDRSGSRAITKIEDKNELSKAVVDAISESFEGAAIIEEFIDGEEYSCECISQNGKHQLLAFTKKITTGAPHFIEVGHIEPSGISAKIQKEIENEIFKALTALGIKNGASHTEFKLDSKNCFGIIEIGARMGGDCIGSDLVKLSTGYDFVENVIKVAVGEKIEAPKKNKVSMVSMVRFAFDEEDWKRIEKVKEEFPESVFFASEDKHTAEVVKDSSTRLGFVIFVADTKKAELIKKELLHD